MLIKQARAEPQRCIAQIDHAADVGRLAAVVPWAVAALFQDRARGIFRGKDAEGIKSTSIQYIFAMKPPTDGSKQRGQTVNGEHPHRSPAGQLGVT